MTVESPVVHQLWLDIHKVDEWARYAGSVGDEAHQTRPSYHNGFNFSRRKFGIGGGRYSLSMWGDTHIPKIMRDDAAAIDISCHSGRGGDKDEKHLAKIIARFHHLAVTNPKALCAMGIREFAGPDGKGGVFAMSEKKRPGRSSIFVRTYGWDQSHRLHIHISINRRFTRNKRILKIASLFA